MSGRPVWARSIEVLPTFVPFLVLALILLVRLTLCVLRRNPHP